MKKFLVVATTLVAGTAIGLVQAADEKKPKGGGTPEERAAAMIKTLDKDDNKTLSKEEFLAGPAATKAKADGKDVDKMFAGRDKNKDGQLDLAELSIVPKPKGKPGEPKPEGKPAAAPKAE